jgi:hypothetical protein
MEENKNLELVKEERGSSLVPCVPYEVNKTFKKTRTIQNDELNFFVPEKWDYDQII